MLPLHVDVVGSGPDVVLLHGLPSPPEDLAALAVELTENRVLVPHLPGYGQTPARPGQQGVAAVTQLLVEALQAHSVREPALVGFSMGGYRALALAPLVDARSVLVLGGFADLSDEERAGMKGFADALRAGIDVKAMLPPRFLSPAHRAAHPEDDACVEAWADCAARSVLIEELDDCAAIPSLFPQLGLLACPVVARTGELDGAVPAHHAEAIARAVRHGRVDIRAGAGHVLYLEDRANTIGAIRSLS